MPGRRWLQFLSHFDFKIHHRKSAAHGNADGLSRAPHIPAPDGSTLEVETILEDPDPPESALNPKIAAMADLFNCTVPLQTIKEAQRSDQELQPVILHTTDKTRPSREQHSLSSLRTQFFFNRLDQLLMKNDILHYRQYALADNESTEHRDLVVLPEPLRTKILTEIHEFGHHGINKTIQLARSRFFCTGMAGEVEQIVNSCQPCQLAKNKPPKQHTPYSMSAGYPGKNVVIDFVGPLPKSSQGNEYILTIACAFTRWVEAYPCKTATAAVVIDKLINEYIPRFSVPETIRSDRGSHFTAHVVQEVCKLLRIQYQLAPSYQPQAQGIVERQHATLASLLKKLCNEKQAKWQEHLNHALFAMRVSKNRTTKFSPFELVFGRSPGLPLDLAYALPIPKREDFSSHQEYARALHNKMSTAFNLARQHIKAVVARQREQHFKPINSFNPGDKVWLFAPITTQGIRRKFLYNWSGPWSVASKINPVVYKIVPSCNWLRKKPEIVGVDRLRPYYESEQVEIPPPIDLVIENPLDDTTENLEPMIDLDIPPGEQPQDGGLQPPEEEVERNDQGDDHGQGQQQPLPQQQQQAPDEEQAHPPQDDQLPEAAQAQAAAAQAQAAAAPPPPQKKQATAKAVKRPLNAGQPKPEPRPAGVRARAPTAQRLKQEAEKMMGPLPEGDGKRPRRQPPPR